MPDEKYDEVTRNNIELEDILVSKYLGKEITLDVIVEEIKALEKVIFIPGEVLNRMQLLPQAVDVILKESKLEFAQLVGYTDKGQTMLGVVVGPTKPGVAQVVSLYNAALKESANQPRH